jgi:hypothetical protein
VYEAKFTPTLTGVHNVLVEIEGGVFNAEYQVDVIKGKKIGQPKIVGFNFRSLCPEHPAVCHLFFPDLIKPTEFVGMLLWFFICYFFIYLFYRSRETFISCLLPFFYFSCIYL